MGIENESRAIQRVDYETEQPPSLTIEEALQKAIDNGLMTIKEAQECAEAYYQAFNT